MNSEQQLKYCSNCKKDGIPADNYVVHTAHCLRNIALCKLCLEPVQLSKLQAHELSEHATEECEKCRRPVERHLLEQHRADECPRQEKQCIYCDIGYPAFNYKEHVEYCGSRTESCEHCKKRVCLRDTDAHAASHLAFLVNSRECLSEQSNRSADDTVCVHCGSSISSAEYSEHLASCGNTKVFCDTCLQKVLLKNLALHLNSGCNAYVTDDAPRTWSHEESFPHRRAANDRAEINSGESSFELDMLGFQMNAISPFAKSRLSLDRAMRSRFERGLEFPAHDITTGVDETVALYRHDYPDHEPTPVNTDPPEELSLVHSAKASQGQTVQHGGDPIRNMPVHGEATNLASAAQKRRQQQQQPASLGRACAPSFGTNTYLPMYGDMPITSAPQATPQTSLARESTQERVATTGRPTDNEQSSTTTLRLPLPGGTADSGCSSTECSQCHEIFPLEVLPDHQTFCGVCDEYGEHVLASAFKKRTATFLSQPRFESSYHGLPGVGGAGGGTSFDDYGAGRAVLVPPALARARRAPAPELRPCQLCHQLIPADRMDDHHQGACYGPGDAIMFKQIGSDRQSDANVIIDEEADRSKSGVGVRSTPDRPQISPAVEIPCQFCQLLVSDKDLDIHQTLCSSQRNCNAVSDFKYPRQLRPQGSSFNNEMATANCRYCGRNFFLVEKHEATCLYR